MMSAESGPDNERRVHTMTIKEFEQLTGCYPTSTAYAAIEQAYRDFDGDKAAFCQAFQENQDGLASRIRDNANQSYFAEIGGYVHEIRTRGSHLRSLRQQVEDLTRRLEREQEWKPSEDTGNVLQEAYEELAAGGGTRKLTEEEAKELLCDWFGFEKQRIQILSAVPVYEVNRHRQLRKTGERKRPPLYNATDWNYIYFCCGRMSYELHDGELDPYLD